VMTVKVKNKVKIRLLKKFILLSPALEVCFCAESALSTDSLEVGSLSLFSLSLIFFLAVHLSNRKRSKSELYICAYQKSHAGG